MPAGQLDLLLDQVEVIQQPFGRWSDAPAWIYGEGRAIEAAKYLFVTTQAA
jgi:hypothetical protein